jgi:hypothetical protein
MRGVFRAALAVLVMGSLVVSCTDHLGYGPPADDGDSACDTTWSWYLFDGDSCRVRLIECMYTETDTIIEVDTLTVVETDTVYIALDFECVEDCMDVNGIGHWRECLEVCVDVER